MLKEEKYCNIILNKHFNQKLVMNEEDELKFKNEKSCHICNEEYKVYKKQVRDHDHYTGEYMGSAHRECNIKFYYEQKLNVF